MGTPITKPLPCIVCGFQPKPVTGEGCQPLDALMFDAGAGHYGSIWDHMSSWRSLTINVCDKCLIERADRAAVVVSEPRPRPEVKFMPWDPEAD